MAAPRWRAVDGGEQRLVVGLDRSRRSISAAGSTRAAAPVVVDAQPLGDDGHPRVEAALAGEAGHRPQRPDERLLGQLLGDVAVADPALAVARPSRPW